MLKISGAERSGQVPHYTWEDTGVNGYHLNGTLSSASILQETVFPLLAGLPKDALVADFGCGEGRVEQKAPSFKDRTYIFRGFELNSAAVDRFNRTFENGPDRAEIADLTNLQDGRDRFHAALFWRVLHSIPKDIHQIVLTQITDTLKSGASLHVAALSESDWKREGLEQLGLYIPGQMNECYPVMKEALEPEGIQSWPLYFFRTGELARLGEQIGLVVVDQRLIQEESGFKVLRENHPPLSYDYIRFIKQ